MRREIAPPYHSAKLDKKLMADLVATGVTLADVPHAQRDVSVVGGLISTNHVLYGSDAFTIMNACKQLSDANIPIHPKTKFYFYNLLPPVGSDFLKAANPWIYTDKPQQSAILVVCGICSSPAMMGDNVFDWLPPEQQQGHPDFRNMYRDWDLGFRRTVDRLTAVSAHQTADNLGWTVCAGEVGANFVFTRGGDSDEINSLDFLHENTAFEPLVDTTEDYAMEYGSISGSLGILVRKGFAKDIARMVNINSDHLLGQRIMQAATGKPIKHRIREKPRFSRYGL